MTSEAPAVSVVVPTWRRLDRLERLLDELAEQTLPTAGFEVLVVADAEQGAPERVDALLRDRRYRVRRLTRHAPGASAARNRGWREARAPVVAFTDDDCEPASDWLERGLAACRRWPEDVVQGRTDPIPRELDRLGPYSRTMVVHKAGPYYETCNIFYPRALLARLEGFDERYEHGGEDTDLGLRALDAGAQVRFADDARVHHAVEDLGPVGLLRIALRWSDTFQILRRHPHLRARLDHRIFWKRSHRLLLQAALAMLLARAFPPAGLLALPYARELLRRCRETGAPAAVAPYFCLHDAVEVYAAARGAVRYRVLVI